jgi:hypothetical protein
MFEATQAALVLFGVTAVYLSQSKRSDLRKWACIVGMIGQPFWFIAAYPQPGMLIVVALYTFCWGQGIYTHWIKETK